MSPLTLPGTIPGLLRRGSPVRASNDPERLGVVVGTGSSLGTLVFWHWSETTSWTLETPVDLDLTDPTGRAHAAWWVSTFKYEPAADENRVVLLAMFGLPMTDAEIERLRLVCLHVAGSP
jgi:hypothetical protein